MTHDKTLSEININVDGITQDEIIQNRKAGVSLMADAGIRGNWICMATMELDALASRYAINSTYSEELDDDDL